MNKINYDRIAATIEHMKLHFKEQPSLDEVAEFVGLSPFHFQRLFIDWAGVSPKKFIQYLSVEHAKKLLADDQTTLLNAAYETGLSGTSRLHDLFVSIEGMTPGEFKNGGECLTISYSFAVTPFGKVIVASTSKGICHLCFEENELNALLDLKSCFPNAKYNHITDVYQQDALSIFKKDWLHLDEIKLHLKGTEFQIKVWGSLLKIPFGRLASYGTVAKLIDKPKASRAVGTAIASNPVAFLIPCHRVIQASGNRGGYRWGGSRKAAIIGWESSRVDE
jgi:AraC family transcriptional regulator of adaptative response/methylated-DNA-[protein]-cysteine methyltransferase